MYVLTICCVLHIFSGLNTLVQATKQMYMIRFLYQSETLNLCFDKRVTVIFCIVYGAWATMEIWQIYELHYRIIDNLADVLNRCKKWRNFFIYTFPSEQTDIFQSHDHWTHKINFMTVITRKGEQCFSIHEKDLQLAI